MPKTDMFGWDLLYKVTQPQIKTEQDVLICVVHWKLIHEGFKCVGIGEDTTQPTPEEQSETLPEGWNAANKYILRYIYNGKLYILNATLTEGILIVNLNRICDNTATGTSMSTNAVQQKSGPLEKMIPTHETVIKKIQTELIKPMFEKVPSKDTCTQTPAQNTGNTSSHPLLCDPRRSETYVHPRQPSLPAFGNPYGPPIGRSDLDPFAPPGGGMIFQPPGFGPRLPGPIDPMMPPGAVPPGARFDPLGPLGPLGPGPLGTGPLGGPPGPPRGPNRGGPPGRHPDHDHLPPPGYDDMFM